MSVLDHQASIRLGVFVVVLVVMGFAESVVPRRRLTVSKPRRWTSNLGLAFLNALVVRAVLPLGVIGMAMVAEEHGWGLLNNVNLPDWLSVVLAVVALDLTIYFQHVLFHEVPIFWRVHMVHHSDLDFDVTTGLRFHTLEILVSLGFKFAAVAILGPGALGVLCFEVLLNATSMFNHGNIRLPVRLDRLLRLVLVTPDMHRVHHSVIACETNSNFGFNLPWWDFVFGTYRAQPGEGHSGMAIGLAQVRGTRAMHLLSMLALPLDRDIGQYPITRRDERS